MTCKKNQPTVLHLPWSVDSNNRRKCHNARTANMSGVTVHYHNAVNTQEN